MESKNAKFLREGVIDQARRMTPAQRVRKFIAYSNQMRAIHAAGAKARKAKPAAKSVHGR